MSVASEIQRIAQAKVDLRNAITAKGVKIADTDRIDTYAAKIGDIQGGSEGSGKYRVRFFDYDGTILKTVYTDGGAVEAPAVPDHERLLFQEWNNDFDNITDDLDVGAIYTTKSGADEFDVALNSQTGLRAELRLNVLAPGLRIEWGDGSSETVTATGVVDVGHDYTSSGSYTIKIFGRWKNNTQIVRKNYDLVAAHLCNIEEIGGFSLDNSRSVKVCTIPATGYSGVWEYAFNGTKSLAHINIPRLMGELGFTQRIFCMANSGVRHVVLPSTCKKISGSNFFQSCANLEDIVLPSSLDEIGSGCFADANTGMSEITVPPLVTKIGDLTFRNRQSLSKVVMRPTTPPTIAEGTFTTDGSLKEIIVPKGCGEAYKSATNWSYYADIIREETEND